MEFLSNHVIEVGLFMYALGKIMGFLYGRQYGRYERRCQ